MRRCVLVAIGIACCSKSAPPAEQSVIHTLRLPAENVTMPDGPGRDAFTSACVVCHSPRYVLDQPKLPRKTWQAEVDKMKNVFGAPIAPDDAPKIVDYLVAVQGDGS